eukprot:scaffold869_cov160-Ochromonas_danica.AAC.18
MDSSSSLGQQSLAVPVLLPGVRQTLQTHVLCVDAAGRAGQLLLLLCAGNPAGTSLSSGSPLLSASVKMPPSYNGVVGKGLPFIQLRLEQKRDSLAGTSWSTGCWGGNSWGTAASQADADDAHRKQHSRRQWGSAHRECPSSRNRRARWGRWSGSASAGCGERGGARSGSSALR